MGTPIKHIVVVGGGTAGWITAGLLAAKYIDSTNQPPPVNITLVESPDIGIIGVGEGTWPTMVNTLKKLGIAETEFLQKCDASFKQGSKFRRWVTGEEDDYYYHPFSPPQGFEQINLVPQWQNQYASTRFAHAVSLQAELCDRKLAPKQIDSPEYASVENHGYHLDAGKFAKLLMTHCTEKLGITHLLADVIGVNAHPNGDIASLTTKQCGNLAGDLFIDCSGTAALLIGKHYKVPFISKKHILFIDKALAVQIPYLDNHCDIESATVSTAQSAGWIWDINLPTRRGVGHVFSSTHVSVDMAQNQLKDYLRNAVADVESLKIRELSFNPGHRGKFWLHNCVAVGLAAGFLEPLEASALVMIELAANTIRAHLPATKETMDIVAAKYNENFLFRWERVIDFLKLHYVLSKRTDSAFWIENKSKDSVPESLDELLSLWRYQSPSNNGFLSPYDLFPAASYQYILYGMDFKTEPCHLDSSPEMLKQADLHFQKVQDRKSKVPKLLPSNRELLNAINRISINRELNLHDTETSNWIPVPLAGISNIAKTHPLFFKKDMRTNAFHCIALTGFEKNENLFPENSASNASTQTLSETKQPALESTILQTMDLFEPVNLDITFKNKSSTIIKGLYVISKNKLERLSTSQRQQLEQNNLASVISEINHSLKNVETLIEKKNRLIAQNLT